MTNRRASMKEGLWIAAGWLAAVAAVVAVALLGLPHRGVSGIHVTGVRIVERPEGGAVLAWTGDNEAGTRCRYATRLGGPVRSELPRGRFTADTELPPPHAIAWLRIECSDDAIQVPWDMSKIVGGAGTDRAPTERGGRVRVAHVRAGVPDAKRIAANLIRRKAAESEDIRSIGTVTIPTLAVGSDDESVWLRLRATAEADLRRTTCNVVSLDIHIEWERDSLEPRRTDLETSVSVSDTDGLFSRAVCAGTRVLAGLLSPENPTEELRALLSRPVGRAVWQWLLGADAADSKLATRLRRLLADGDLRVSALTRDGLIDVRATADGEWLGRGATDLGSVASLGNGRAAAGAVSYSLVNRLLGTLSSVELRDLGLAGKDGGVAGDAVAIVDSVTSKLAADMDRRLGRGARIKVAEDLDFRLPLAVGPDGEHGVHVYLKGADVVRGGGGTERYRMWAHARTRLACPSERGEQDDRDVHARADAMRRGISVTAGPDGAPAIPTLAVVAASVLRAEQAGLRDPDPLRSVRTRVARYCFVRTPLEIGHGLAIDALWNDPGRDAVVVGVGTPPPPFPRSRR